MRKVEVSVVVDSQEECGRRRLRLRRQIEKEKTAEEEGVNFLNGDAKRVDLLGPIRRTNFIQPIV